MNEGKLIVLSGPSGVGKGTVKKELLKRIPSLSESVSATTRKPRLGEENGKSYYFLSEEEFERRVQNGEFLEACDNFFHRYGTLKSEVDKNLKNGLNVLLEIDVQGALKVKKAGVNPVMIMLFPPSKKELAARLVGRNTESASERQLRYEKAVWEMEKYTEFDFSLLNDDIDKVTNEIISIVETGNSDEKLSESEIMKIING